MEFELVRLGAELSLEKGDLDDFLWGLVGLCGALQGGCLQVLSLVLDGKGRAGHAGHSAHSSEFHDRSVSCILCNSHRQQPGHFAASLMLEA